MLSVEIRVLWVRTNYLQMIQTKPYCFYLKQTAYTRFWFQLVAPPDKAAAYRRIRKDLHFKHKTVLGLLFFYYVF